ncbi:L-threonylcarbamoyladenylate synthase [Aurantiacibacter aquimixticola]|uniref:Threonylcarbamoyl-AMP synthase n=1 Tax=Aurantiacibacter aquimixticola TaxID=1958945 RepID=A0A419RUX6_9SPHN|nr:L-threonylcarbamoyladenylate synthase [Aurantiacibacter aquimixticola]RJY09585.1 threonylcarbamoyl-AMP synthase [Aurantiacibacter aquimixticola]
MMDVPRVLQPDAEGIALAARLLGEGSLVALPTETVYGLAARADDADAVASIYRLKGRPDFNPLIVHVASHEMAERLAHFDARARALAKRFWPGPLTLVLPLRKDAALAKAVTAALPTVALRMPEHPVARQVLKAANMPVAAPSANRSNRLSPTRAEHVSASFGEDAPPVLDGGACRDGVESSIVALRADGTWEFLRPGPIDVEVLTKELGPQEKSRGATVEAPGQLATHYSPGKPLRLDVLDPASDEYMIGFGDVAGETSLSPGGDLAQAAARLYECLHIAAASARPRIAVAPIPSGGIGQAIDDRLRRAAADQSSLS